jgi:sulfate transport system substrate-binding protein
MKPAAFPLAPRDGAAALHDAPDASPRRRFIGAAASLVAVATVGGGLSLASVGAHAQGKQTLLNVSYDVTREFYKDYNAVFAAHWKATTGGEVTLNQSHGGSSKQARSIVDGLEADVITMNQANDIDILHERGNLIPADWARRLPNNSAPTTSTSVILVRKGNPKGIKDWADLAKPGVSVVIPNPKISGNGRYTYLAAYGSVLKTGGDDAKAKALVAKIFGNVPVFDGGGRAATTTFAQRNIGDALATFESEVALITQEFGANFDVVYPPYSVLAENPVSVVDKVADKRGTRKLAEAYLAYLYSPQGQEVAAKHHMRPRDAKVLAAHAADFPKLNLFTVDETFGGWTKAQKTHFDDGGVYDQVFGSVKR